MVAAILTWVHHLPRKGKRDLVKEQFWRKALERFRSSGKSRAEFCATEGLSSDVLVYWAKVIGQRDAELVQQPSEVATQPFVPVVVANDEHQRGGGHQKAVAEIVFSEGSILLFKGIDRPLLQSLFQALRESAR